MNGFSRKSSYYRAPIEVVLSISSFLPNPGQNSKRQRGDDAEERRPLTQDL